MNHFSLRPMAIALIAILSSSCCATTYKTTFLPTSNITDNIAFAINRQGQVVGTNYASSGSQGYVWDKNKGLSNLGCMNGNATVATDLNDSDSVIGTTGSRLGFVWDDQNGFRNLGDFGGNYTVPKAINTAGTIVGFSYDRFSISRPFIWDGVKGFQQITNVDNGTPIDINDNGQILINTQHRASILDPKNGFCYLSTPGGTWSQAISINNKGEVLGMADFAGGRTDFFIWDSVNGFTRLNLDTAKYNLLSMNDMGQIVGYSYRPNTAVVFDRTTKHMDVLSMPNQWSSIAYGINNSGEIVGYSELSGVSRSVIWQPVPEPSSILALFGGIGILGAAIRRRK